MRRKDNHEPLGNPPIVARELVAERFNKYRQAWTESDMCRRLKNILASSATNLEMTKIVAVSLGRLSYFCNDRPPRHAYQHAMVLTMRDWLAERNGTDAPCYVQDPDYDDVDKSVLAEHKVQVLEDPMAWLEIDDTSIVVSIASNVPSKEIVADIARPAVVIWNRVGNDDYDQKGKPAL